MELHPEWGNRSGAEDLGKGAGGRRMVRDGALAGEAANGFPVAVCGGNVVDRDRRRDRVERGSCEGSSIPCAAVRASTGGEVAMNDFRVVLARFRDAVRQEGEQHECPGLQAILKRERSAKGLRLGLAAAAAVV